MTPSLPATATARFCNSKGNAARFSLPPLLQNQFDSIDLSDNSIVRLEGFPKLPRLQCLHLNNNRINRIARNLEGALCCWGWLAAWCCCGKASGVQRHRMGMARREQQGVCIPQS